MNVISPKNIENAIKKIDGLSEDALDKIIETYALKQEDLLGHVMQAGVEYENEDLNTFSIYYFAIVMAAFEDADIKLKTITQAHIDEFQEPFVLALDEINKNEDYTPLHELINQPSLTVFMANEIDAEDEDGEVLSEETKTQLFIVMSSMIGLMNYSIVK